MRKFAFALLVYLVAGVAQAQQIRSGSTIYIEPMGGYETYLAAAFTKLHVPLIVVAAKDKAEFVIISTLAHKDLNGGQPSVVVDNSNTAVGFGNASHDSPGASVQNSMQDGFAAGAAERRAMGETSASIAVIDPHSTQIVFAYSAGKMGTKQIQKTAEDCAKHLKEFIEKPENAKH